MIKSFLNAMQRRHPNNTGPDGYLLAIALNLFAVLIMLAAIVFLTFQAQTFTNQSPSHSQLSKTYFLTQFSGSATSPGPS